LPKLKIQLPLKLKAISSIETLLTNVKWRKKQNVNSEAVKTY